MSHSPVFFMLLSKLSLPEKVSVGLAPCFYPRKNQLLVNLKKVYLLSQKSELGIQWKLLV